MGTPKLAEKNFELGTWTELHEVIFLNFEEMTYLPLQFIYNFWKDYE